MYCNIGFKTDCSIGKSAIRIKDLKDLFEKKNEIIAVCDNGNISQLVKSLQINKNNIPAVELYIVESYDEKRAPSYVGRFFAFDETAYSSICKMIGIANQHKHYSPRIAIDDLILDGDMSIIVDDEFLFLDSLPYEKTYVAVNADTIIGKAQHIHYRPIFYYDSYALYERDLAKVELLSARGWRHEKRVWYFDITHYHTASLVPESIKNYNEFIEKASKPVIKFENKYPVYCEDSESLFDALVDSGFKRKYPNASQEHYERLKYEKDTIKRMGYCDYFIITWDFIHWARTRNIPIGPGRGSAAGSIVAYCLDITKIDPIANGLYFERFLNPERVSPPDIDTDINQSDRQDVIEYIKQRYNRKYVSQIIAFTILKSKSAFKDACKLHNIPFDEQNKITGFFPPALFGTPPTLDQAAEVEQIKEWIEQNPTIWKEAKSIENFIRQTTVHPAGLIIAPQPLNEIVGLSYDDKGEPICQFNMSDAEKFGLLKMDFLGLATLGIIKETCRLLGKSYYDMENIPINDDKTYEAFAAGDTHGIFQFESEGMKKLLRRIVPNKLSDIAAANALYRPGPLTAGLADAFAKNKHATVPEYFIPEFKTLLEETYGVFVYQEQVMLVAQTLAGFTLSKADILRKAIGKKDKSLMQTLEKEFVEGAISRGYDSDQMNKLWKQIVGFADYCFNKSHAYAYSVIAYWTMYLKIHHPKEFAVALLSADMKDSDKMSPHYIALRDLVTMIPPDINTGKEAFQIMPNGVMIGFGSIKGLGANGASIEKNGPYRDIVEVVMKNSLDKTQFTSLVYSGAFDSFESDRTIVLGNQEKIMKYGKENRCASDFFNLIDPIDAFSMDNNKRKATPVPAVMEKICYGYNINYGYLRQNSWLVKCLPEDCVIAEVMDVKYTVTKSKGQSMSILTLNTSHGKMTGLVFPSQYAEFGPQIIKDKNYAFFGEQKVKTTDEGEEQISFIINDLRHEHEIKVKRVDLYSEGEYNLEGLNKLLIMEFLEDGETSLQLIDRQLEGNTILGTYKKQIKYTKELHDLFLKKGFDIRIELV